MIEFYNSCRVQDDSNVTFHTFLNSFPNNLKFLRWDDFPQRSFPQEFCPDNLVTLDMHMSDLEQLWEKDKVFCLKLYIAYLCTFGNRIIF